MHKRQRNVQKSVMHVRSCWFFLTSSLLSRSCILRSHYYGRLTRAVDCNKTRHQLFINEWNISSIHVWTTYCPSLAKDSIFCTCTFAFSILFPLKWRTFVVFLIEERINNQDRRRWRRESKKIFGIFSKITSHFLLHFFNIQCKTTCTTWKVLTRRFMENGNCRKIRLHLTNWPRLKKCDKVLIVNPLRFADRNRLVYFWGAEERNRDNGGVTFLHSLPNLLRRFPLVFSYLCSIRAALSYLNA